MLTEPMLDEIPLVDLHRVVDQVAEDVQQGFRDVLREASFVGGRWIGEFERAFARFTGRAECVGVANGTDALEIALRAVGISAGDEVIVPANSFAATAEAVLRISAVPVFVDVTEHGLLDPEGIGPAVTARTAAVLPVHLYGQMADMDRIASIAADLGLAVVEDAAQAHGARQQGCEVGERSMAAAYSFYPGKNLGAFGDAGGVVTDDRVIAQRCRMLAQHGARQRYQHEIVGFNSRLDSLQAVVLSARLRHLAIDNALRRHAATRYDELLRGLPITLPAVATGNDPVWHLYVISLPDPGRRDEVLSQLQQWGIGAGVHYPIPLHLADAFRSDRFGPGDLPVAEKRAAAILSLPMFPQITVAQQARVVEGLARAGVTR